MAATVSERALVVLAPLDHARARALRVLARVRLARPLFRDRALRVLAYGLASVVAALVATCVWPTWVLALGPIALGVPHLLADLRYLVARPRLHERAAFWIAVAAPTALVWSVPRAWVGLLACVGAAVIARTGGVRKVLVGGGALGLAVVAYVWRGPAEIVVAHAHNLVALASWAAFWRAPSRGVAGGAGRVGAHRHLVVVGAFVVAALFLFLAPLPAAAERAREAAYLSPVASGALVPRFVLFFAFAQSVHYAVWLRLVPEEARPRAGVRSFGATARALISELGAPLVCLFGCAALALAAWALVDLRQARLGYLRVALTHGYLEIAVAALWLLEGHGLRARPEQLARGGQILGDGAIVVDAQRHALAERAVHGAE